PEPGETRRKLERPPGERYLERDRRRAIATAGSTGGASRGGAIGRGAAAALGGAAVMTLLGGPLSVTLGLVVVAAFVGWIVASLVRPLVSVAVALAVGSVALGLVGIWLFAGLEGGALGLVDYLGQVQGPLVVVELAVAGLIAYATIR
ncbi:MAG TPA: hypothetical protein VF231_01795, partial [Candidatus Limnocylindrales bacterium]